MKDADGVDEYFKPECPFIQGNEKGSTDEAEATDHFQPGEETALIEEKAQASKRNNDVSASDVYC